jgi:hypothetical protein
MPPLNPGMMMEIRNRLSRSTPVIFVFLLVIFCLIKVWNYGELNIGTDFREKWDVGQEIAQSSAPNIYFGEFFGYRISTPFLYSLFSTFSSGDYARDLQTFRLLCLVSGVLAIIGLSRLLGYSAVAAMAAIVVFMDWFQPLLSDVRVANVNQLQLGVLALFLWFQSRRELRAHNLLAGLVLGLGAMSKPNLMFVVLMLSVSWLINRRFRKAAIVYAGIILAAVGAFIFSSAVYGSVRCWIDWLSVVPDLSDYLYVVKMHNYAPAMLIFDWAGIKTSMFLTAALLAVATFFVWVGRRNAGKIGLNAGNDESGPERELLEDMLMVSAGCLIYLLSATLVWLHYFVLTVPMALIILRPSGTARPTASWAMVIRLVLAAAAIVVIAELPIRTLFSVTNAYHSAMLLDAATLTLFGLGMWELLSLGKGVPSSATASGMSEKEAGS